MVRKKHRKDLKKLQNLKFHLSKKWLKRLRLSHRRKNYQQLILERIDVETKWELNLILRKTRRSTKTKPLFLTKAVKHQQDWKKNQKHRFPIRLSQPTIKTNWIQLWKLYQREKMRKRVMRWDPKKIKKQLNNRIRTLESVWA